MPTLRAWCALASLLTTWHSVRRSDRTPRARILLHPTIDDESDMRIRLFDDCVRHQSLRRFLLRLAVPSLARSPPSGCARPAPGRRAVLLQLRFGAPVCAPRLPSVSSRRCISSAMKSRSLLLAHDLLPAIFGLPPVSASPRRAHAVAAWHHNLWISITHCVSYAGVSDRWLVRGPRIPTASISSYFRAVVRAHRVEFHTSRSSVLSWRAWVVFTRAATPVARASVGEFGRLAIFPLLRARSCISSIAARAVVRFAARTHFARNSLPVVFFACPAMAELRATTSRRRRERCMASPSCARAPLADVDLGLLLWLRLKLRLGGIRVGASLSRLSPYSACSILSGGAMDTDAGADNVPCTASDDNVEYARRPSSSDVRPLVSDEIIPALARVNDCGLARRPLHPISVSTT
ncbi:hypothetical protein B0H11DRAFT_2255308 [Mycena galericulata]|nr:hypothetical protein B0H11DRAFT_2255308 [Mycena galericulata]